MIQLDMDSQGIATLLIEQPNKMMNVIDWDFIKALDGAIDQLLQNANIVGVIVTSGKGSFVAGADLGIMSDFVAPNIKPNDAAKMIGRIGNTLRRLETLGKPVVGASTGTALGGGLELLLACHYRIAADNPAAIYGLPEVSLGLLPGAGGTQRLPRLIGIAKALPLMLTGRHLRTQEALELGILNQVVPKDQLLATAKKVLLDGTVPAIAPWDQKGFRMPGGDSNTPESNALFLMLNGGIFGLNHGTQPAQKAIASCVYEGSRLPIDRALRIEQTYFAQIVQGPVSKAMIQTLFFSRQVLEKTSSRPQGSPKTKLQRITVMEASPNSEALKHAAQAAGIHVDSESSDFDELVIGQEQGGLKVHWYQMKVGDLPALMELVPSANTSEDQLALGFDLARQLRAVPILLSHSNEKDWPHGYVHGCVLALFATVSTLIDAGVSAAVINNSAMAAGWPNLEELATIVKHDWPIKNQKTAHVPHDLETISNALLNSQKQIASKALNDHKLLSSDAINLAAILGAGFPRHLGGPLFSLAAV